MKYLKGLALIALFFLIGCEKTSENISQNETESLPQLAENTSQDEDKRLTELAERITPDSNATGLIYWSQAERQIVFKHIDRIYPTRTIHATDTPYPLGESKRNFTGLTYRVYGTSYTLNDFTNLDANIGLIVVQNGNILFERYASGNDKSSQWISFSVTKSVTSMLIGAAIKDGYIKSVDEPVVHFIPELEGTAYQDATIRNILHMSSGVAWNENYKNRNSDIARAGAFNGLSLVDYLAGLPKAASTPGEIFNYNTGETNLMGDIL